MSEAIPGIDFPPQPTRPPRDAAAVVLVRETPHRTVFWVRRGPRVSFSGGFHAFPGGTVDPQDATTPIDGCPDHDRTLRVCALRELFEEAGVLLARGVERLSSGQLATMRAALLAGAPFAQLLAAADLMLDGSTLIPAGRWLTPPFSPVRFDARFYLCVVPASTDAAVVPGELSEGGWIEPTAALRQWEVGTALLHPPNQHALATLAGHPPEAAVPRLQSPPFMDQHHVVQRIEFQRGIVFFPMLTPTLPPAQHTHCYVVGTGDLAVVDPGSPWPDEQQKLWRLLDQLVAEGRIVRRVLLTHHHLDHVGAAVAASERYQAPIAASAATLSRCGLDGIALADGDRIELAGPRPMQFECLLTEGHADGHLAFIDLGSQALIAGDMVAGGSTIVIDPPEGNLGVYLDSLKRLRNRQVGTIYPAHGHVIRDGIAKLTEYVDHRERRMEEIRVALSGGAKGIAEVVQTVYAETPSYLHPLAERSALASLLELERRQQVRRDGDGWCRTR